MQAEGHHEGEDTGEPRLAIATQLTVRDFISKSGGDGPVCAGLASGSAHEAPSGQRVVAEENPRWGYDCIMASAGGFTDTAFPQRVRLKDFFSDPCRIIALLV